MTSAGVKVKEKKTKTQEKLLTLALPNQSNAVIYYITSAFPLSSLTLKEKMRTGQEGRKGAALEKSFSRGLHIQDLTSAYAKKVKKCAARTKSLI